MVNIMYSIIVISINIISLVAACITIWHRLPAVMRFKVAAKLRIKRLCKGQYVSTYKYLNLK